MTDSDIIKALECCTGLGCDKCKFNDGEPNTCSCEWELKNAAMEVLKRKQEEIERLKAEKDNLIRNYKECAAEAVRDFAGRMKARVKERVYEYLGNSPDTTYLLVGVREVDEFDELVAEMEDEK